jgi:glucosamine--fructose-6-phosphate aminotransferase (isomerizing)
MCGIFGLVTTLQADTARQIERLFLLSESRGKEAAGIAIHDGETIEVFKQPHAASEMIHDADYRALAARKLTPNGGAGRPHCIIGHSRLVTNGLEALAHNNQPIIRDELVIIHNGIIVNDAALWAEHAEEMAPLSNVDTEIVLALYRKRRQEGDAPTDALAHVFGRLEGTASVAIMQPDENRLLLATNNGSLYLNKQPERGLVSFASERYILGRFLTEAGILPQADVSGAIRHLHPYSGIAIDMTTLEMEDFPLPGPAQYVGFRDSPAGAGLASVGARPVNVVSAEARTLSRVIDHSESQLPENADLKRCSRCILPETMPFIAFDDEGVCNYCHTYQPLNPLGLDALRERVEPFRRRDGEPDCMVAVSGGRDSCYGLHILKREIGLNPVAYTYDWGLITDLARRNQARLCGRLGVEHILVSADIRRKRDYVRRNVEAWLKRPMLGMVPLFMAGDKQYFYYANQVRRQLEMSLSFLCENKIERAHFKNGFMGIDEGHGRTYNVGAVGVLKTLMAYGREYLLNPRYINRSLFDTFGAFWSSFIIPHDHEQLYRYAAWNEDTVVDLLRGEYDWEISPDTDSTWRIGDGTAPFYNYIYYTVAGFTENDALRSNQIREGVIDRDEALRRVRKENQPRWESMRWYAEVIGFNLTEAIVAINSMPRLYGSGR